MWWLIMHLSREEKGKVEAQEEGLTELLGGVMSAEQLLHAHSDCLKVHVMLPAGEFVLLKSLWWGDGMKI